MNSIKSNSIDRILLGIALSAVMFGYGWKTPVADYANAPLYLLVSVPLLLIVGYQTKRLVKGLQIGAILWICILIHTIIVMLTRAEIDSLATFIKMPALAILIGLLSAVALRSPLTLKDALVIAIKFFLCSQLVAMAYEAVSNRQIILGGPPVFRHYFLPIARFSGMFAEPSHLAAALTIPIVYCLTFTADWWKRFGLFYTALLFCIGFACPSATLVLSIAVALCIRLLLLRTIYFVTVLILMISIDQIFVFQLSRNSTNPVSVRLIETYHLLRGDLNPSGVNISSLVVGKAAYAIGQTLQNQIFGFGFDNAKQANAMYGGIYDQTLYRLNATDFGSVFAKCIVEFGWVGVCILLISIWILIAARSRGVDSDYKMWTIFMLAQLFVNAGRSSGYFEQAMPVIFATVILFAFSMDARRHTDAPSKPAVPVR